VPAFDVIALPDNIPVFDYHTPGGAQVSANGIEIGHGCIQSLLIDPLTFRTCNLPVFLWKNNHFFRWPFTSIDEQKENGEEITGSFHFFKILEM